MNKQEILLTDQKRFIQRGYFIVTIGIALAIFGSINAISQHDKVSSFWIWFCAVFFIVNILLGILNNLIQPFKTRTRSTVSILTNICTFVVTLVYFLIAAHTHPSSDVIFGGLYLLVQGLCLYFLCYGLYKIHLYQQGNHAYFLHLFACWHGRKFITLIITPLTIVLSLGLCWVAALEQPPALPLSTQIQIGLYCGLFFTLFRAHYIIIRQTASPSKLQRKCRSYFFWSIWAFAERFPGERKVFQYWLSHPGIEITEELKNKIENLEPRLFDWQNPKEWPF